MTQKILEHCTRYLVSIGGGLLCAFEATIPFFVPCFILVIADVWAAYALGKRIHRKYPNKADGKFKSSYKYRILYTMIVILLAVMCANYVDINIIKQGDLSVRFVVGVFIFYQLVSILENWSSENNHKMAKVLQRILVNKAERHLNVPLADLFENKEEDGKLQNSN